MALSSHWSRRASVHFLKTVVFLEEEWGIQSAKEFVQKTDMFLKILETFPEIGKFISAEKNIRGFVIVKQITLFYKLQGNKIILIHFFNNLRSPQKRF